MKIWQEYVNSPHSGRGEFPRCARFRLSKMNPLVLYSPTGCLTLKARTPSASLKEVLGAMVGEFLSKGGSLSGYGSILSRRLMFLR